MNRDRFDLTALQEQLCAQQAEILARGERGVCIVCLYVRVVHLEYMPKS